MTTADRDPEFERLFEDLDLLLEDLPPAQVLECEARLLQDPRDRRTRLRLLQFAAARQFHDPVQRERYREHTLWFIEHEPEGRLNLADTSIHPRNDPSGYAEGERLWLAHLQRDPTNLSILRSAAEFFTLTAPARARSLVERAELADPENPDWPLRLGDLCELHSQRTVGDPDPGLIRDSLHAYQRALAKEMRPYLRPRVLCRAAPAALLAGELAAARSYAQDLLAGAQSIPGNRVDGEATYTGHSVLGLLALRSGELDEAARELLEAGKTRGSPVLSSFGPELDLADGLLQHGRTEVVVEFLELCKKFWEEPRLQRWIDRIHAGERPRLDRHDSGAR